MAETANSTVHRMRTWNWHWWILPRQTFPTPRDGAAKSAEFIFTTVKRRRKVFLEEQRKPRLGFFFILTVTQNLPNLPSPFFFLNWWGGCLEVYKL